MKERTEGIVIEAQKAAAIGMRKGSVEAERSRVQLQLLSAILATLSYTLTQLKLTV